MVKNLLIGLGGTGSRIVNYVAADLKKKNIRINDGNISCAVIDRYCYEQDRFKQAGTDVLSFAIRNPSGLHPLKTYFDMYENCGLGDWLPTSIYAFVDDPYWHGIQMRTGARLEFYDYIKSGAIGELEKEIDKLLDGSHESVNVQIVSSLAGATGSGMLIQAAMWVRKYLKSKNVYVTVKGILVLPDVLIRTIRGIREDKGQCRALRANAYATIRELNAITKAKMKGKAPKLVNPIKLDEVDFDSSNDPDGAPVFDKAYLMGDVTAGGSALHSIIDYEKVIARLVYMQIFDPRFNQAYVEYDDALWGYFKPSIEPLYGSCGTAKAEYPVDSVLKYCALRAAKEELSADWSKIDRNIWHILKKQFIQGVAENDRVDPRKEYIRQFEELSQIENGRDKLFYKIRNDIRNEQVKQVDGKEVIASTDKVEDFLKAFNDTVKAKISHPVLDENDVAREIADIFCPVDMSKASEFDADSVKGLFTKKDEEGQIYFVHPITIRYLLYKLFYKLEDIVKCSNNDLGLVNKASKILMGRLETFIKIVESFFNDLDKICADMDYSIAENVQETEDKGGKAFYICSSREDKESIYDSLNMKTGDSNKELNKTVATAFYEQLCVKENPDAKSNRQYAGKNPLGIFANELIKTYEKTIRDDYSEEIDLDLYSAVCKSSDFEYKRENGDVEEDSNSRAKRHMEAMKDLVRRLERISAPFLNVVDDPYGPVADACKMFWGFNPALAESCKELGGILGVNTDTQASDSYDKCELNCYQEIYGIKAENIDMFNEEKVNENDNYYASYEKLINKINKNVADDDIWALVQTPHLDKTWHKILPYISKMKRKNAEVQLFRNFWLAVAYGMITVNKEGQYQIERTKRTAMGVYKQIEPIEYKGSPIAKSEIGKLIEFLQLDDLFERDVDEYVDKFKKECHDIVKCKDTLFLNGIVIKDEKGDTVKHVIGGLGSDSDTNALTLIVRYLNASEACHDIAAKLVSSLESLCFELAKGEPQELYKIIYNACELPAKDIDLIAHWSIKG